MNVHQMVTSAKQYFNDQVDRTTYSVDTSQALFLVTFVITQWTHKQSGNGFKDKSYSLAQQHGLSLSEAH